MGMIIKTIVPVEINYTFQISSINKALATQR